MWSPERRNAWIRTWLRPARLAGALALAALLGGCFEPLYGQRSLTGGPGLRQRMASVDVARIDVPNGTLSRASPTRSATISSLICRAAPAARRRRTSFASISRPAISR